MGDRAGLGALEDFRERRALFGARKDECEVDEPTVRKQCGGERQSEESREFRGQQRLAGVTREGWRGKENGVRGSSPHWLCDYGQNLLPCPGWHFFSWKKVTVIGCLGAWDELIWGSAENDGH